MKCFPFFRYWQNITKPEQETHAGDVFIINKDFIILVADYTIAYGHDYNAVWLISLRGKGNICTAKDIGSEDVRCIFKGKEDTNKYPVSSVCLLIVQAFRCNPDLPER